MRERSPHCGERSRHTQNLARDEADRVTSAGPLTFQCDDSGLVDLISDLSGFERSRSYDGAGREQLRVDGTQSAELYRGAVTRDNRGLVTRRVETVAGQPARTLDYTYDDAGRLQDVKENGAVVERHRYDLRGNRISVQRGADPSPARPSTGGPRPDARRARLRP